MKTPASTPSRWLPNTIFALIFLSLLFSGWLWWQQFDLRNQISVFQESNKDLKQAVADLESQDVGTLFAANQILETALSERTEWSKVAQEVLAIATADPDLTFAQVQVDPLGQVSVGGKAKSLKNVAVLLQQLRTRESFSAPFVPSVTGEPGSYQFQLQFAYSNL